MKLVVIPGGQLSGIHLATPPAALRLTITDGLSATYEEIYKAQPQVRTVISFIARNIADLALHTYRRVSDTDRERVTDHPLPQLLAQPVPGIRTAYRWMEQLVSDVCIFDLHYAVKVRNAGRVVALLRVHPGWVEPKGGTWFAPDAYEIRGTRGKLTVKREDMLVIHGYNPTDDNAGLPPIEALRQQLMEEYSAARYRRSLWDSGARISGVLKRPPDVGWSDEARARFLAEWKQLYSGVGGGQAGGTPLLEDGMEFQPLAFSARDTQYIDSRKLTREEAAAAYHVPPPMVGILDHATFSNITEQHKNLYQDTLGPWLTMIQQELGMQLVPEFADSDGLYVEFNLAQKLRGSLEEQATQIQTAVGGPWLTRNEARARQNLPAIDGGDALITPLNVTEGGQASPTDSAPPPKSGVKARADEDAAARGVLRKFFERQASAVLSALGAGKPLLEAFDTKRWDVELAADLLDVNVATAQAAASAVLAELDGALFDGDRAEAWLMANAAGVASGVNAVTLAEISSAAGTALEAARAAFARAKDVRAAAIAAEQVTSISGFAVQEVAQQSGRKAIKTWRSSPSTDPRSSHAAMSGQSVPVGQKFSNGARWPGDSLLPAKERANCHCHMSISWTEEG